MRRVIRSSGLLDLSSVLSFPLPNSHLLPPLHSSSQTHSGPLWTLQALHSWQGLCLFNISELCRKEAQKVEQRNQKETLSDLISLVKSFFSFTLWVCYYMCAFFLRCLLNTEWTSSWHYWEKKERKSISGFISVFHACWFFPLNVYVSLQIWCW